MNSGELLGAILVFILVACGTMFLALHYATGGDKDD